MLGRPDCSDHRNVRAQPSLRKLRFCAIKLAKCVLRRDNVLSWTRRRNWLIEKFRSFEYPVGIFCYNDYVAADIIGICLDSHIHIPEQVAVIGVDDDPIVAGHVPVPLSSVRHDLEGMAYRAAELLDQLMSGRSPKAPASKVRPKGVVIFCVDLWGQRQHTAIF
jgi:LacI family transcriptional regulator